MLFKEVSGQEQLKEKLIQAVNNNRLSHAILFLGPEGSGNLAVALALAQFVNCENRGNDACGECSSCIKASKMIHPDIHFSFPVISIEKRKLSDHFIQEWREKALENPYLTYDQWIRFLAGDQSNKQGNITAAECEKIIGKLKLKSFEAEYKILIIWLPEYLGKEGNRLLKIIEEPPDKTLFLLVANNPDRILNTILSRTQIIHLHRLNDEDIQDALKSKFDYNEEQIKGISEMSDGNYAEALNLINSETTFDESSFVDWLTFCGSKNVVRLLDWLDEFQKSGRENQKVFINYALHFFRESMMLSFQTSIPLRLQNQSAVLAKGISKRMDFQAYEKIIGQLDKAFYYIERNANPKILMMNLSISLTALLRKRESVL